MVADEKRLCETASGRFLSFMEREEWVKAAVRGHTPREAKDNLKSTQLLSVIDAISEGPVEGPVDGLKKRAAEQYASAGQ
ncbi:hypothetical protein KZ773_20140 [Escherichia coli]|nr:hypothetical protein [Escherichia coli]